MNTCQAVLERLSDGRRHSGAGLAESLGITRAAVWKQIEALRGLGLNISGAAGGGYQLDGPLRFLDAGRIRSAMPDCAPVLETRFVVDSTNRELADLRAAGSDCQVLIAEGQRAGRGRRGRSWLSPPGRGIYCSVAWSFESGLTGLGALSLVTGLSAADCLAEAGLDSVRVKWPNDLVVDGAKLGGCLVEIGGSAEGPCRAIVGLGINVAIGPVDSLGQPVTDLQAQGLSVDRDRLAGALIQTLSRDLARLDADGFGSFSERWRARDALAGRAVIIHSMSDPVHGRADGVDATGRLWLDTGSERMTVSAGEVSVRAG